MPSSFLVTLSPKILNLVLIAVLDPLPYSFIAKSPHIQQMSCLPSLLHVVGLSHKAGTIHLKKFSNIKIC